MNLTPEQQAFFDRLDEEPQRRAGGFITSVTDAGEHRSRPRVPRPRLEAANARLAIYRRQLEREEQEFESR